MTISKSFLLVRDIGSQGIYSKCRYMHSHSGKFITLLRAPTHKPLASKTAKSSADLIKTTFLVQHSSQNDRNVCCKSVRELPAPWGRTPNAKVTRPPQLCWGPSGVDCLSSLSSTPRITCYTSAYSEKWRLSFWPSIKGRVCFIRKYILFFVLKSYLMGTIS